MDITKFMNEYEKQRNLQRKSIVAADVAYWETKPKKRKIDQRQIDKLMQQKRRIKTNDGMIEHSSL